MSHDEQAVLVIASRLLGYPTSNFENELQELVELTQEAIDSDDIGNELMEVFKLFEKSPLKEIQELYVATFDLRAKTGLYLTAHELGDSTKRGAALIKLQKIISEAGFERVGAELVDYMPMLLEFLAIAPDFKDKERLKYRLAIAFERIRSNLDETTAYSRLLQLLMVHVFPNPSKEEVAQLENNREEADLEELPYPIMYQ